jgi:hypothetical protein
VKTGNSARAFIALAELFNADDGDLAVKAEQHPVSTVAQTISSRMRGRRFDLSGWRQL